MDWQFLLFHHITILHFFGKQAEFRVCCNFLYMLPLYLFFFILSLFYFITQTRSLNLDYTIQFLCICVYIYGSELRFVFFCPVVWLHGAVSKRSQIFCYFLQYFGRKMTGNRERVLLFPCTSLGTTPSITVDFNCLYLWFLCIFPVRIQELAHIPNK